MRPPEFWNHRHGRESAPVLRALLTPAAALYAWAGAEKLKSAKPEQVAAPVICVGNLTLGGAGKTPIVRRLREILAESGVAAHVVSRGHGGAAIGPLRVDAARHTAAEVGDEPLLHAKDGPAWVARDRAAGARAAIEAGAGAIILDDGFQNGALAKTLSLIVFDAESGIGNGQVFPAGPLREPVKNGLKRADIVVLMQRDLIEGPVPDWLSGWRGPLVRAALSPTSIPPAGPLLGFAGIGRPEKFFDSVKAAGGALIDGVAFADHHAYTAGDLAELRRHAAFHGATLITTEKDFARLAPEHRASVAVLAVVAHFADEAPLRAALDKALACKV